jgi:hypothetical protein
MKIRCWWRYLSYLYLVRILGLALWCLLCFIQLLGENHRPSTRHHQVYHVRLYRVHLTLVVIASKVNGYQNTCTIITIKATPQGSINISSCLTYKGILIILVMIVIAMPSSKNTNWNLCENCPSLIFWETFLKIYLVRFWWLPNRKEADFPAMCSKVYHPW